MGADTAAGSDERVIVVGAGLSGLACALGLALRGREVTLLEKSDRVGGAAAFSGGQVWAGANHVAARERDRGRPRPRRRPTSAASPTTGPTCSTRRRCGSGSTPRRPHSGTGRTSARSSGCRSRASPTTTRTSPGALLDGRYVTGARFDGSRLGPWRERLQVSPHFPIGTTYDEMFEHGRRGLRGRRRDERHGRPADVRDGDRGCVLLARPRRGRYRDPARAPRDGAPPRRRRGRRRARRTAPPARSASAGQVVLATSAYDWDAEMVGEFLGLGPDDFGSAAPRSIAGDGHPPRARPRAATSP